MSSALPIILAKSINCITVMVHTFISELMLLMEYETPLRFSPSSLYLAFNHDKLMPIIHFSNPPTNYSAFIPFLESFHFFEFQEDRPVRFSSVKLLN